MNYDNFFEDNGFTFLNDGLLHNVFEKDGLIYKVLKPHLDSFNTGNNFHVEVSSHKYLKNKGFNVATIEKIYSKNELIPDFCVLVEKKINGKMFKDSNINPYHIMQILSFIKSVSFVDAPNFGEIYKRKFENWNEYLIEQINIAKEVANKYFIQNKTISLLLEKNILSSNFKLKVPKYLIMDPNVENFFFVDNEIIAIDIDHPIGGDPLWQGACIYWYKKHWRKWLLKLDFFNENNYLLMLEYCIVFGLTTYDFLLKNNFDKNKFLYDRLEEVCIEYENKCKRKSC